MSKNDQDKERLEIPMFDDDVTEADNPVPKWWAMMWILTIAFSVVYFAWYSMFGLSPSLEQELVIEVARAKVEQEVRDREIAAKMELTMSPAEIGKKYFKNFCVSCHGNEGEGGIGPNFHDLNFIHPPTPESLVGVVTNGVASKGMPAWGAILGDRKVKALVAYVSTLPGTPLAVQGKAPEGTAYAKDELMAMLSGTPKAAVENASAQSTPEKAAAPVKKAAPAAKTKAKKATSK